MKVSDFLGKKIISTAGKEGYILSVNADGQSVFFVCADCNEREFTVNINSVSDLGESVVYDGTECKKTAATPIRLGRAGFDMRGNYLGTLEDFTLSGGRLKTARIGKKNYPAEGLISGDVIIVKDFRRLKSDVIKDGRTLFKKGAYVTDEVLEEAAAEGEYIQTTLKTL